MAGLGDRMLISTAELGDRLGEAGLVVLDVSARLTGDLTLNRATKDFEAARVPGSRWFDVARADGALSDPSAPWPWTWPDPERIATSLAEVGVQDGDEVVIAARSPRPLIDWGTMWCTRTWWTLHHSGLTVRVLYGGLEQWEAEGRQIEAGRAPEIARSSPPIVHDGRGTGMATKDDVLNAIEHGQTCVIDALQPASYTGEEVTYARGGHIPTAANVPFYTLVDGETAVFPAADELRRRLQGTTAFERPSVITYCGGAIAATVPAFALTLLGVSNVRVYDGSLMEWSANESLPLHTADETSSPPSP
jgi:thiosulfate/3-mercaptopyruvate sulfurtransferase